MAKINTEILKQEPLISACTELTSIIVSKTKSEGTNKEIAKKASDIFLEIYKNLSQSELFNK